MARKMQRSTIQYSRTELSHIAAEYFPDISPKIAGHIGISLRTYCEVHQQSANYRHFKQAVVQCNPEIPTAEIKGLFDRLFPFTEDSSTPIISSPRKRNNSCVKGLKLHGKYDSHAPFTRER